MLDVLNRYARGYVAMLVIVSCKKQGLTSQPQKAYIELV